MKKGSGKNRWNGGFRAVYWNAKPVKEELYPMSLADLSPGYRESARLLQSRMKQLRKAIHETDDPEEKWRLQRRIADLTPILTQMNELAELTAHYYDPGFWRNEKYTL